MKWTNRGHGTFKKNRQYTNNRKSKKIRKNTINRKNKKNRTKKKQKRKIRTGLIYYSVYYRLGTL